jgi:hypothetical protein
MDPFARKMIRSTVGFAIGLVLMLAAMTVVYIHVRPTCPDRTVTEVSSPARQFIATVLEHRCGHEAPFVTQVDLHPASEPLARGFFSGQAGKGNVFSVEQDAAGAGVSAAWTAPDELTIRCPHCNPAFIRRQDERWGPVHIRYEAAMR